MSQTICLLAEKAITELVSDEGSGTLLSCFNGQMDEVIDLVEGDFDLWMMVLNVVQNWYINGHELFKDIRHTIILEPPITRELPVCLDPLFWRSYAPQSLRARRR